MGSFYKFLGNRKGSTWVFHSGLWEDSGHKKLVLWLVFSFTSPNGGLVLFQVFCILWKGSRPADIESSGLHPLPRHLFLLYHTTSFALRRALVHLHFSGLPIDLWVVVLKPGITEDYVLPSKARDSKKRPFRVGFVTENYVYHFRDLTYLIEGAIHVVHQYGARDAPGVNTFCSDKISIYEVVHSSRVQKYLDKIHLAGVYGADFY